MRNYYLCNANFAVYTEVEKSHSEYSAHRFQLLGSFKNRAAEDHFFKTTGEWAADAKRT